MIVFAHFCAERQRDFVSSLARSSASLFDFRFLAQPRLALLLYDFAFASVARPPAVSAADNCAHIRQPLSRSRRGAQLFDFFSENDFHGFAPFAYICRRERQQGDVARLLDRFAQPLLMRRAHTGNTPGRDLAALGNEAVQHVARLCN